MGQSIAKMVSVSHGLGKFLNLISPMELIVVEKVCRQFLGAARSNPFLVERLCERYLVHCGSLFFQSVCGLFVLTSDAE